LNLQSEAAGKTMSNAVKYRTTAINTKVLEWWSLLSLQNASNQTTTCQHFAKYEKITQEMKTDKRIQPCVLIVTNRKREENNSNEKVSGPDRIG
jgi:hypothetical protein